MIFTHFRFPPVQFPALFKRNFRQTGDINSNHKTFTYRSQRFYIKRLNRLKNIFKCIKNYTKLNIP